MNALLAHREADYRVIFYREEEFSRRIQDIYFAKSTYEGAPFLDEIADELWDMMALCFIDCIKDTPRIYEVNMRWIDQIIATGDPILASDYLVEVAGARFCEMFYTDVYLYLIYNQLNFFDRRRNDEDRCHARQYNAPILEVW